MYTLCIQYHMLSVVETSRGEVRQPYFVFPQCLSLVGKVLPFSVPLSSVVLTAHCPTVVD